MKHCILSILATAALLAACGGTDTSSTDSPQSVRRQAAPPSIKQEASDYATAVQTLYIAYFGRPADPNGLVNFGAALQAIDAPNNIPLLAQAYATDSAVKSLIDSFGTSKESQDLYGSGDTAAFVTSIFQNVLGRAPQTDGLSFWVEAIDSGALSRGNAALSIMAGALGNATQQGALDESLIANRLALATGFTAAVSNLNATGYYTGQSAATSARSMLAGVTAATDPASFQTMIATAVTVIAAGSAPGNIADAVASGIEPGLWQGYASNGKYTSTLILEDGTTWLAAGAAQDGGTAAPSGFMAGLTRSAGTGQLTGSLYDYGSGAATSLGGSYSGTALDATFTETGNALTASLTPAPASLYNYDAQADLAAISGYWPYSSSDGSAGTIGISATGVATAAQSSCTFTGTLLPRANGKNVFNVSGTWSGASCARNGHAIAGVAISHALTNGQNELLIGLLDLTNGSGAGVAAVR